MSDLNISTADLGLEPSRERGIIETVDIAGTRVSATHDGSVLAERLEFVTDDDGEVTLTLAPTGELSPDNVFYRVTVGKFSRVFEKAASAENLVDAVQPVPPAPLGSALTLGGLADVNAPDPNAADVLTWDDTEGEWVASPSAGGGGAVVSVVAGTRISVDDTDPANPVVSADAAPVTSVNGETGAVEVAGNEVASTPPSGAAVGDLWFDDTTGQQFVFYDSAWVEVSGGSAVGAATESAAGVVELATEAETVAGSSTTLATTPAGVASVLPAGKRLLPSVSTTGAGASVGAPGANVGSFVAIDVLSPSTVNRFLLIVGASTGNIDVGIYDDDGTGGAPGALITSTGAISCPAPGAAAVTLSATTLTPGRYFVAVSQSSTASFQFRSSANLAVALGGARYSQAAAHPLPATAAATIDTSGNIWDLALGVI